MKSTVAVATLLLAAGCAKREARVERAADPAPASAAAVVGGARRVVLVESVVVPEVVVPAGKATKVRVSWRVAKGTGVNEESPFRLKWTTSEGLAEAPADMRARGGDVHDGFDIEVAPTKGTERAHLVGRVEIVVCDAETHKVCVPVKRNIDMSFHVGGEAKPRVEVFVALPEATAG